MLCRYHYYISDDAVIDLEQTLDYIRDTLCNPTAASNLYKAVNQAIENICTFPYACPDCSYYYIDAPTIRHKVIKNYIIFFEINEEDHAITILRFLYNKQNISQILSEEK